MNPLPETSENPSSRKRPRSLSRDSDSGESASKRAASEGPSLTSEVGMRSPGSVEPQPLSNLRIMEDPSDIDMYMATQDAPSLPWQQTSPAEKLSIYERLIAVPLELGQKWFVVATPWLKNWKMACSGEVDKEGPRDEATLGPVDNSSIVKGRQQLLRKDVQYGEDYEVVPKALWDHFVEWYGTPKVILGRKVAKRGASEELYVECYVPIIKIYRLVPGDETTLRGTNIPLSIEVSLSMTALKCFGYLNGYIENISPAEHRLWRVSGSGQVEDEDGWDYPVGRLRANNGELFEMRADDQDKTLAELMIDGNDEFIVEFMENNQWITEPKATISVAPSQSTLLNVPSHPIFNSTSFFDELSARAGISGSKQNGESSSSSLALQPAPTIRTRSKSPQPGRTPGTLGLGNLGNTCFMNSALQCLAHTEELTEYFLTELYREELNKDNPLGMGGAIAETFGSLLSRIWSSAAGPSSYAPREFKQQLQKFAPQFSGYQQHDSQEFIAFLLDGLHEDLNRVLKKPYVENPDWEGGGDWELVQLARKSWEGYISRNDSAIVDLFQGQYKSTLVCPECQKVSITFDPFMYLTLPLPIKKKWSQDVYFVPWDTKKPHIKIPVEIDNDLSFKDLRRVIGRWTDTNPDNLVTLEIFQHRFYKYLDDHTPVSDIGSSDHLVCFELPCRLNFSRKADENDMLILPVYCSPVKPLTKYSTSPDLIGHPFLVVLSPEEGRSMDAIYAAVMDRMQRWTKNAMSLYRYAGVDHVAESHVVPVTNGTESTSVTEIRENGDVVVTQDVPDTEEADIADVKAMDLTEDAMEVEVVDVDAEPIKIGPQTDVFTLQLFHAANPKASLESTAYNKTMVPWESRQKNPEDPLVVPGDILYCKWDDSMQSFFLNENALWDKLDFEEFVHPELEAQRKQSEKKRNETNIEDCLDEFTKEEQLGEDDPWYCPRCKKHQQATKNMQLWKVPDVLVVHLKRFSNSRIIRDKIDAFIDFPLEGLDLESRVGERQSAKVLAEQGLDPTELGLGDVNEPLLYDLFAVDEHLGGLGGGHYRAYAKNYSDGEWYHFDDSHVSKAQPQDAVNRNAYLLFYRRRTSRPIGGKTHAKIQAARQNNSQKAASTTLPTPPDETIPLPSEDPFIGPRLNDMDADEGPWKSTFLRRLSVDSMPALQDASENGPPGLEYFENVGVGYNPGLSSPVSDKAEGGSDGGWSDSAFAEMSTSPYPRTTLKPASFDNPPPYDDEESWDGIEPGQEPPLSCDVSEAEDAKVIDPQLLKENAQLPPRQLPSPAPEDS